MARIENYKKPFLFAEFGVMFHHPFLECRPRDPGGVLAGGPTADRYRIEYWDSYEGRISNTSEA